jgi:hypothetical protein
MFMVFWADIFTSVACIAITPFVHVFIIPADTYFIISPLLTLSITFD